LLAIVFACVVWMVGKPEQVMKDSTMIGWVGKTDSTGIPAGVECWFASG